MSFIENLDLHIRARYSILYIQTFEEERLEDEIRSMATSMKPQRVVSTWDFVNGFNENKQAKGNPLSALEVVLNAPKEVNTIYVFRDYHRFLEDATISRAIRNACRQLKHERKTIIITAPQVKIPHDLEEDIMLLEYGLPTYEEIKVFVEQLTKGNKVDLSDASKETFTKAFQGLSLNRVRSILSKAIAKEGRLREEHIDLILEEKRLLLQRTEVLEFYPSTEGINDIGGLDQLKTWLKSRGLAFSDLAKSYGLPNPKGVLLVGIQGTGKSLSSKVIAKLWKMPLLRLDVGRLMGSLVGESENRTRQMIKTAEAMAPCVLWIDEIDKAFSGITGVQGDSGTSSRVFGSLITWMQEKTCPVFIVATANNIENLPAELLRKGRFDEIFFIDLPNHVERKDVFKVHLKKRRANGARDFDLDLLAKNTEGFSGAEIEQLIIDAMFAAFSERREFTSSDILQSITQTIPLSKTAKEKIDQLRHWAESGRARPASSPVEAKTLASSCTAIEVDLPDQ